MVTQFERIDHVTKTMLCMVLSGGFSNLLDRIIRGYVVDYISVSSFPVFNLADTYIVIGWIMLVVLTVICVFRKEQKHEKANYNTRSANR